MPWPSQTLLPETRRVILCWVIADTDGLTTKLLPEALTGLTNPNSEA